MTEAQNPLYGRKWKILVLKKNGTEAWSVSNSDDDKYGPGQGALRCTFRVQQSGYQVPWYSEVSIWNLMGDTQTDIIREGYSVIIEAGYENGAYGKIFEGQVFQPLFDRQNVTDFVVTLHCIDGMNLMRANISNVTMAAGYDYNDFIAQMAKSAHTPIPLGNISSELDRKKFPRGRTVFGEPKKYIRQISQDNNAQSWFRAGKLDISKIDEQYRGETVVLTPSTGLVGTPQQIDNGVAFRCLLNPRIAVYAPPMTVKLDMTIIRQMKVRQGMLVSPLDDDGLYKIISVTYTGDTRGNEWYTNCIGINQVGNVSSLLGLYNS